MNIKALAALLAPLLLAQAVSPALAQAPAVERFKTMFEDRLHQQGDSFSLCINTLSMTADFERDLAAAIGDVLLTDVKVVDIEPLQPKRPLDTALSYSSDQIYIVMAEQCDGFMGFVAAAAYPDWLTISRPYLAGRNFMVTKDQSINRLEDIPTDRPVGSRFGNAGDAAMITYLQTLPEARRWKRYGYGENTLLLDRLNDGTVAAAMVWEPMLDFATDGDPAAKGYKTIQTPFAVAPTYVGIGIRTIDSYLKEELGDAIKALTEDGTIDELLQKHHLAGVDTPPQTELNR